MTYPRPHAPARPRTYGVVGAGRVGSVVAARLHAAGRPVVGISARSQASLLRARTLVPEVPVRSAAEVAAACDVLVLAVPDDALVAVTEELSSVLRPGQVVVHTSGRHGLDALSAATRVGARAVALHPAMTFTGSAVDLGRECAIGLTAGDAERELAEDLAAVLGGTPVWIDDADRVRYHAALSHGANHLVTLVAQARDLLQGIGAGAEAATILRPLLEAALDNALDLGDAALTGPIARGDVTTVRAHVDALATELSSTRDAYVAMAHATTERAAADGRLDPATAAVLDAALDERPRVPGRVR
ncbi:MAG: DUF2520 domain-containing protein [Propionibacteriales bacterium]|nr:DUF2520 domain-containing protein [Propionibacteriales bacterium]